MCAGIFVCINPPPPVTATATATCDYLIIMECNGV